MTSILFISIFVLSILSIYLWNSYRLWMEKYEHQTQQLIHNKAILRQVSNEQNRWVEQTSRALHSNLKSRIHAIDIALFHLKKQVGHEQNHGNIQAISMATAASLELIDDLGRSLVSPELMTLGLLPALKELETRFDVEILMNIPFRDRVAPFEHEVGCALYKVIVKHVEQAVCQQGAGIMYLDWEFTEHSWRLLCKDNGTYMDDSEEIDLWMIHRLTELDVKIHYFEASNSGRTIILLGEL